MSETVALYTVTSGERLERARERLSEALGGATLGDPDSAGVLSVDLDAESSDAAKERVRTALAESGTGDDFVLRTTVEGREIPVDDPRQPGAGTTEANSTPTGQIAGDAAQDAVREAAGQSTRPDFDASTVGATGPSAAQRVAKFAVPALVGLVAAIVLRRLRK
jgi:preprotein translocase subunit SecF